MFDPESRYALLGTTDATDRAGREVTLVDRRFLPDPDKIPVASVVTLGVGERLDQVANRSLGRSDQWFRLAETLRTLEPSDPEQKGALRVPVPGLP